MKKLSERILLLAVLLSLLGCSKDDGPVEIPVDRSANLLATGDSAGDFLTNVEFTSLRIQVAYVQGYRPTDEALNNVRQFLLERTFKTDIQFELLPLPASGEESLSLQEIANLENDNRTVYNQGSTLGMYIYFADAPADADMEEEENIVTLGAVYRNTSMVVHATTVRDLSNQSSLLRLAEVETATIQHEFGHLFGLVNLGTPMINLHEDGNSANHCTVEGCLMQSRLEFGSNMAKVLQSRRAKGMAAVPEIGPECLLDLEGIGGRSAN